MNTKGIQILSRNVSWLWKAILDTTEKKKKNKKTTPQYWRLSLHCSKSHLCPKRVSKLYCIFWVCGLVLKEPHAEEVGWACAQKQKVQELTLASTSQGKVFWGIGCHCQVRAWSQRVQLHKNTTRQLHTKCRCGPRLCYQCTLFWGRAKIVCIHLISCY